MTSKSKLILAFLILLNLFWSVAAFVYDWPAILQLKYYFIPFIVICPIYPLLLALVWYQTLRSNQVNPYLLAFAALPSAIYLVGALIFYPTVMTKTGFDWSACGQIFWVAFYGLQGFYLLTRHHIKRSAILLAALFLIVSFAIQGTTQTEGYLDFSALSSKLVLSEYLILALTMSDFVLHIIRINQTASNRNKSDGDQ